MAPREKATAPTTGEGSFVPTLQRGLAILEFVALRPEGCTNKELAEGLGLPAASVFRMLAALVELGYLARDPATKRCTLTRKLLLLGQPHAGPRSLVESSLPAMRGLRDRTRETVQLGCLSNLRMVILEQLPALHPFKYLGEIGASCPVFSCAPGKALLASLPTSQRDEILGRIRFKRYTPTTLASREALLEDLDRIRQQGYALDRAEGLEGIHCVAAPVLDRRGEAVAALTIAGPAARIPESAFTELGPIVAAAAAEASRAFQS